MNILLVEDEAGLATYVVKGLVDNGHAVEVAGRGDLGLEAALGPFGAAA